MSDPSIEAIHAATDAAQAELDATQAALAAAKADDAADDAKIADLTAQVAKSQADLAAAKKQYDDHMATHEPVVEPPPVDPPPVPVTKGLLGQSMEHLAAGVTDINGARIFTQPGNFTGKTQSWTQPKYQDAVKAGANLVALSFKDGHTAEQKANIDKYLATIPKDQLTSGKLKITCTYYHEHTGNRIDGSLTQAQYDAGTKNVAELAHKYGFMYGPIHNGMAKNAAGKWGYWPEVWAKYEATDKSVYDFWGVDTYCPEYEDPTTRYQSQVDYAKSLGLPLLIGETASPIDDQAKQTAWAAKAVPWLKANVWVTFWWSSQVPSNTTPNPNVNYRMSDGAAKHWYGL